MTWYEPARIGLRDASSAPLTVQARNLDREDAEDYTPPRAALPKYAELLSQFLSRKPWLVRVWAIRIRNLALPSYLAGQSFADREPGRSAFQARELPATLTAATISFRPRLRPLRNEGFPQCA